MGEYISVNTIDGAFRAYVATPYVLPAPVVVVIQEIFGVNLDLRDTCDELAAKGYFAISPDLFWRMQPASTCRIKRKRNGKRALRSTKRSTMRRAWQTSVRRWRRPARCGRERQGGPHGVLSWVA